MKEIILYPLGRTYEMTLQSEPDNNLRTAGFPPMVVAGQQSVIQANERGWTVTGVAKEATYLLNDKRYAFTSCKPSISCSTTCESLFCYSFFSKRVGLTNATSRPSGNPFSCKNPGSCVVEGLVLRLFNSNPFSFFPRF